MHDSKHILVTYVMNISCLTAGGWLTQNIVVNSWALVQVTPFFLPGKLLPQQMLTKILDITRGLTSFTATWTLGPEMGISLKYI